MISTASVLSALVLYSAVLAGVCLLRRQTFFLEKCGVSFLMLASVFAIGRLLLPIEIPVTYAVRSWSVLGVVQRFLRDHPAVEQGLLAIWGAGAVVAVGWDVFVFVRARRRCRTYTIVDDETVRRAAARLNVDCPVMVTPDVEVPCAAGIFRHVIYLPPAELPEWEIEMILAHEAQHIHSHDGKIKLFVGLLTAVMWWNPIAQIFRREAGRLLELRCDAKVTRHMDKRGQTQYLTMLQHMADRIVAKRRTPALALDESQAVSRDTFIKQRFKVILAYDGKPPRRVSIMTRAAMLAVFCVSYLVIVQPAELAPAENFQNDSRTVYEEEYEGPENHTGKYGTFIIKGPDGRYQLCVNYTFVKYLSEEEVTLDQYKDLHVFEEDRTH